MSVLGYSAKLKRGLGLTFGAHFRHQWTRFQCHILFLSQSIKQNVLLSSYLDKRYVINFKIFLESTLKQWLKGKNRGDDKNTKILIPGERKELFR